MALTRVWKNAPLWAKDFDDAKALRKENIVHPHIDALLGFCAMWVSRKNLPSKALVITSLVRPGDNGVHGAQPCRGVDLRMSEDFEGNPRGVEGGLTLAQAQELEQAIDVTFYPYAGWDRTSRRHQFIVKPHGTAPHVHMQCSSAVGFESSNHGINMRDVS